MLQLRQREPLLPVFQASLSSAERLCLLAMYRRVPPSISMNERPRLMPIEGAVLEKAVVAEEWLWCAS